MLYRIARILAFFVLHVAFFLKIANKENMKYEDGCIYIANHKSNWDPVVLGFSVKNKPVCYLAKEELFSTKTLDYLMRGLNCIPVSRSNGDIKAVKTALHALKNNKNLGIFPEGTRSKDGKLLPFEQGAALIAIRAGVPIIPTYIKGNYKLFKKVTIYAGKPIFIKSFTEGKKTSEAVKALTEHLEKVIGEMEKSAWEK